LDCATGNAYDWAKSPLGAVIRELRTEKSVTLEALDADAGISKNMLSLIERGEGNPSWSTVEGVAGLSASRYRSSPSKLSSLAEVTRM
jgi:transcriptional regulator with XRE-family HTH domain